MTTAIPARPPMCQRTNAGVADLVAGFLDDHGAQLRTDGPDERMRYVLEAEGGAPAGSFRTVRELGIAIATGRVDVG